MTHFQAHDSFPKTYHPTHARWTHEGSTPQLPNTTTTHVLMDTCSCDSSMQGGSSRVGQTRPQTIPSCIRWDCCQGTRACAAARHPPEKRREIAAHTCCHYPPACLYPTSPSLLPCQQPTAQAATTLQRDSRMHCATQRVTACFQAGMHKMVASQDRRRASRGPRPTYKTWWGQHGCGPKRPLSTQQDSRARRQNWVVREGPSATPTANPA